MNARCYSPAVENGMWPALVRSGDELRMQNQHDIEQTEQRKDENERKETRKRKETRGLKQGGMLKRPL
jgi:hypothetical protein